jgi:ribulose-phosphate 3-epimerase
VRTFVSLLSGDAATLARTVARLDGVADGFHVDVTEGPAGEPPLLGPDLVARLDGRLRSSVLDVHLRVADPDSWVEPFAAAGADLLTLDPRRCRDARSTLARVAAWHVRPGIAHDAADPAASALCLLDHVDRVLVTGRVDARALEERVALLSAACGRVRRRPEVVVEGVPRGCCPRSLALAGADGIVADVAALAPRSAAAPTVRAALRAG